MSGETRDVLGHYMEQQLRKHEPWDVIVVGAGPGGSIAARDCARQGLKTLVIDKRQELGTPVRCGEGLGQVWIKIAGLEYDPSWCLQEMRGAAITLHNGEEIVIETENRGYIIERKEFEKRLAEHAIAEGATYIVKTLVNGVIMDEQGCVAGIKCKNMEGEFEVKAKLVIAADGVDSQIARFAGIRTHVPVTEVDTGFQYYMTNMKIKHPNLIHLFIGNDVAPRGYVWIFPKADDKANVGIGITGWHEKTPKWYLDKFINEHPEYFENASIAELNGGCCPVTNPIKKPYAAGLLVVGDAAHMVNAIHGGGIGNAMEAGRIAATVAKEAVEANDFSEGFLKLYNDRFLEIRGNQLNRVVKVRKFFEKLSDADIESLHSFFKGKENDVLTFSEGDKLKTFASLFARNPRLAVIAAKTLLTG
ncbi:MAG: NAD(P)/FAD-dependent oxidoreductase [DPANN group archaeon]|nr:NAD(P)/FAD-dependent oxidoreductase [DPANN group archaeon]